MKISIIIEWENVLLSEMKRCTTMFKILQEQALALKLPVEIIILSNPEQVSSETVRSIINKNIHLELESSVAVHLEEAIGCHYYELKNYGASLASGEILVFVDTDVIPEDGWLRELIAPILENTNVDVVSGNTYIDPVDGVNKAFALGWFFPMRETQPNKEKHGKEFWANNVAFRKTVFDKYTFPPMPSGMTRGACSMLAKKLTEHNIPILINSAAQTHHPAPKGWWHFSIRALANGRDKFLWSKMKPTSSLKSYLYLYSYAFSKIKQTFSRSFNEYDYFKLTLTDKLLSYSLMSIYYVLVIVGGTLTLLSPTMTAKWWRV